MMDLSDIRELLLRTTYFSQPFFVCLTFVLLFDRFAASVGMVDRPDARKDHEGLVPLIGGPAIFVAIAVSLIVLMPQTVTAIFLVLAFVLVVLGVFDDRFDLPVRFRVAVQAAVAVMMVTYAGVEITEIGNPFWLGQITLGGYWSLLFTVVCTLGVINAVNMIDGLDGLAGSVLALSFCGIGWLCFVAGYTFGAQAMAIFVGALAAFLCFNARLFVPRARVFMGDSGSMLMGFILAWFSISMTQFDEAPMTAVTAGWVFGLPLIDTVSVMVGRVLRGSSPFAAGRDHLHHRLRDAGLTVNETVGSMATVHGSLVLIGVLSDSAPNLEPIMFWTFVGLVLLYHFLAPRAIARLAARQRAAGRRVRLPAP